MRAYTGRAPILRVVGLGAATTTGSLVLWRMARPHLRHLVDGTWPSQPSGGPSLSDLALTGCVATAVLCWTWLVVCVGAAVTDVLSGSARVSAPWVPRVVRVGVVALLGLALASPASADTGPRLVPDVAGLRVPDRMPTVAAVAPSPSPSPAVVVRPGDCLWTIAARLLPSGAPHAAVAVASRRLAGANRDRLGPDTDLIFPGTTLRVPEAVARLGKEHA